MSFLDLPAHAIDRDSGGVNVNSGVQRFRAVA